MSVTKTTTWRCGMCYTMWTQGPRNQTANRCPVCNDGTQKEEIFVEAPKVSAPAPMAPIEYAPSEPISDVSFWLMVLSGIGMVLISWSTEIWAILSPVIEKLPFTLTQAGIFLTFFFIPRIIYSFFKK